MRRSARQLVVDLMDLSREAVGAVGILVRPSLAPERRSGHGAPPLREVT
ncbi:hypothetical protein BJ983_005893 [Actinomycetospora corticicola]|uniref:Uncharacterized protein n=1 Tax=Actinomycetospora corticicola TaxID=663602 RepID=A0A7Y9E269_9PSEU|nr:hypothetical protein [Actinomycetospora corticicola]